MSKLSFNALIPELTVSNIHRTKEFYIDVLGFTLEYERKEEGFIFLSFHQAQMMFEQYHDDGWNVGVLEYPYGRGINFEIATDDIQALYKKVIEAGIKPYRELKDTLYHVKEADQEQREFLIKDPDGYLLRFIQE